MKLKNLINKKILALFFSYLKTAGIKQTLIKILQFTYNFFIIKRKEPFINFINSIDYIYSENFDVDQIIADINVFSTTPLISIIMPVYNTDPKWLKLAIKSVEEQFYPNWELCIADDASTNTSTIEYLKSINNPKIKISFLKHNINISGASNEALKLVKGDYIALMDHDDEITKDALYEVIKELNIKQSDFIYSDEDRLELDGSYSFPHFKAQYSESLFMKNNYISHLGVIKKELVDKVGGWERGVEGAQDYDLYLKVLEQTSKITNISKVLYHWRKIPGSTATDISYKSYAHEAGKKALQNAMKRRGLKATVLDGKAPCLYSLKKDK